MPKNTKLYKIFNNEKKGVLSLLNKLDLINLSSFLKLCDQAQKTIKNKKKIIFLEMAEVHQMLNIWPLNLQ